MKTVHLKSNSLAFLGAATFLAVLLAALRAPAANWALDSLAGAAALTGATVAGARLALRPPTLAIRRLWQVALALLLVASVNAFGGPWMERFETHLGIDDARDVLVLLAVFAILLVAARLEQFPAWSRRMLWLGLLFQIPATLADVLDDGPIARMVGPDALESVGDLCEFLALQFYVVGTVTFVAAIAVLERAPAAAGGTMSLGRRARADMLRYIAHGSLRGHCKSRLYVEGARPIMFLVRTAWCLRRFGAGIAAAGRPLPLQTLDMLRLGWGDGVDPILYPTLELYRPERRNWADHALSRYEVGNGLLRRLHKLRPTPHGMRVNLGDKLAFHRCCQAHGLPTPRILIHATRGQLRWIDPHGEAALDCDLFIKPRQSRGARNSLWLHRIAPFTWRTQHGETWSRADLLDELAQRSRRRELLLQPMLTNHAEVADLADQSLIAIRIFTCMNEHEQPMITHAMLRVLSKLEPRWHGKREYAARIDLESGLLGRMCNDKDLWPGCWSDRHPVTGAAVVGRRLQAWPQIRALALAAQRVFSDRALVGWDIALTPAGPVILEGNSYPDVHFLQRVHEQPIGFSRLAPVLRHALDAARDRDRHMI